MTISRRSALLGGAALLAGCAASRRGSAGTSGAFVRREGVGFRLGARPYRFVGTNMWYAP